MIYHKKLQQNSAKNVDYQSQRVELKSYPVPFIRESLLNTLCHCDFSFRLNSKIVFFK